MPTLEYQNKMKWDTRSHFVNANPVLITGGVHAGKYGVPADFLSQEVLEGSSENEDLRSLLEAFEQDDVQSFKGVAQAITPQPPPPPTPEPVPTPPPIVVPPPPPPLPPQNITWLDGSFNDLVSKSVDTRLQPFSESAYNEIHANFINLFSLEDHANRVYVRNVNSWVHDLNFTGISNWNSAGVETLSGTAITPRHLIGAAHFEIPIGATFRFVTLDNQIVDRVIVGRKRHPDYKPHFPDLEVYTLDSDLPSTVKFYKILPNNFSDWVINPYNLMPFQQLWSSFGCPPVIGFDQENKANVFDCMDVSNRIYLKYPNDPIRKKFWENPVGGDSSSPYFFILNNEPILLGPITGSALTHMAAFINDLNQMIVDSDAMAGVSTGYTVTTIDLSNLPLV